MGGVISLKELMFRAYPGRPDIGSIPDIPIRGLECDSRKIEAGFLFVALRGVKADGHEFIKEALTRGAVAVAGLPAGALVAGLPAVKTSLQVPYLVIPEGRGAMARLAAVFYGEPAKAMKVIGITGTNGKTTTTFLLEHLLGRERKKVGVIGTVNYRFAGRTFPAIETTPGPARLQELLSQMRDAGCDTLAMEVSAHALDQSRTDGIDFEAALFTNLTQDHLDYFGTLENYFQSKARLFSGLSAQKLAVLNADDPYTERLKKMTAARVITFGFREGADLKAVSPDRAGQVSEFELHADGRRWTVRSPLVGRHNIYNALGALALASGLGFDLNACVGHLESFAGVPGRLERVDRGQDFLVFVDYAHTPDGLQNVMQSLKPYKRKRLSVVFGCGGERDRGKRPLMAAIAARLGDFVYVTSDNPRSEDPLEIAKEVCAGFGADFKNYEVIADRRKAIRKALLSARKDDIVLLAGKGHEMTQIIGDQSLPFSDKNEAERVLDGH